MARRQYAGGAAQTTITNDLNASGDITIPLASVAGWPDGSQPFAIVVDPGGPSEEKMLVTARSGTNLTVTAVNRGYDGTSAVGHASGAEVWHTLTAIDLDEANAHVNASAAAHAASAISNTPAGSIAATTVQAAINELDTSKAEAVHVHATSDVTGFDEAVRDTIGATLAAGIGIDIDVDDAGDEITVSSTGPLGIIAFDELTSPAGAANPGPSTVPGLSLSFTAVAGRAYKIGVSARSRQVDGGAHDHHSLYVRINGTIVIWTTAVLGNYAGHAACEPVPVTAGSCSVDVQLARSGGSGTAELYAAAAYPCRLWVEDIGPALT